jgi:putative membrane protein
MENVMESLKNILRGAVATSAVLCLVSLGASAQSSTTGNSDQQSTTTSTKHAKKSSKSSSSSDMGSATSASSNGSSQLSAADKKFVMEAAQGGEAEVELGQLATQNAQSDDVKKFGQRMVDDHTKANDQLKQLAQQKGVSVPSEPAAKDKALKDKLSNLKGDQFDKMYMSHMVMDHKKDVAEFKKESTSAKDNDVKNWASQTLPTLQDHLKEAQQIASTEKGASATSGKSKAKKSTTSASMTPKK